MYLSTYVNFLNQATTSKSLLQIVPTSALRRNYLLLSNAKITTRPTNLPKITSTEAAMPETRPTPSQLHPPQQTRITLLQPSQRNLHLPFASLPTYGKHDPKLQQTLLQALVESAVFYIEHGAQISPRTAIFAAFAKPYGSSSRPLFKNASKRKS
ncbi:hypothetical protein SS50377_27736 [Spironucleus salmonicida]|uniref:Uncharacterized protein n=1 Tax=Spironucleus salmonicida TaxID=348837 RepID=A0A9P8LKL2_9EUKA|nr:hypothetical protein SS50377_27736 [Spironucleus salmonicida]